MAAPSRIFLQEPVQAPTSPPAPLPTPAPPQAAPPPQEPQEPKRPERSLIPFDPGQASRLASTPYDERGELALDLYGERQAAEYQRFTEAIQGLGLSRDVMMAGVLSARDVYGLPGGDLELAGRLYEVMTPEDRKVYDGLRAGLSESLRGLSGQVVPEMLQSSVWKDPQQHWLKFYRLYSRWHGDEGAEQIIFDILDAHVGEEERGEVYGRAAQAGTLINLERGLMMFDRAMTDPEANFYGLFEQGERQVLERGYVTETQRLAYGPEPMNVQKRVWTPEKPLDQGRKAFTMFLVKKVVEIAVQNGVPVEAPLDIPETYGEAAEMLKHYKGVVRQALQVKWGTDALRRRELGEEYRFHFSEAHLKLFGSALRQEEGTLKLSGEDEEKKARQLMELFERIQRGEANEPVEMAGGIKLVNVLMDTLLSGSRFMGTTASVATAKIKSPYIVNEVGVTDDWLGFMEDALHAYETDPYFIWEESADLVWAEREARDLAIKQYGQQGGPQAMGAGLAHTLEFGKRAVSKNPVVWSETAHPWKPTLIPLDAIPGKSLPKALAAGVRGALHPGEGIELMDALFQMYTAGENPTRPGLHGVANFMSLMVDIAADPLNIIAFTAVTRPAALARKELKLIKGLEKEGFRLGAKTERAGVRSLREVAADLRGVPIGGPRMRTSVPLVMGGKLNPDLAPGFQLMHAMFGDSRVVQFIYEEVRRRGPKFLQSSFRELVDNPIFSYRLFRHMKAAGLGVNAPEDAAGILYDLFPLVRKATDRTNYNALSKIVPWTRWTQPQMKAARSLYVAGIPLFSPVTDPIARGLRAAGKGSRAMAEMLGIWKPATKLAREAMAWRDYQRALVSFDAFSRVLVSGVKTGRGMAPLTIPLDGPMNNALRARVMARGSREGYVEEMMSRWAMITPDQAKEFGLKSRSVDEDLASDIFIMLDMGRAQGAADFEKGVQNLALAKEIKKRHWKELSEKVRGVKKAVEKGEDDVVERLTKDFHARVDEISEDFFSRKSHLVDAQRERMLPYQRNFDEARAVFDEVGGMLTEVGALERGLDAYAPHYLTGVSQEDLITAIADPQVWDSILLRKGLKRIDTTGSMFNLHRQGPPTILEAQLAGIDFSTDMYSVMKMRLQKAVDDIENFHFMNTMATELGVKRTWSRNAIRRLVSEDFTKQMGWVERHDHLLALGDEWVAKRTELKEIRKQMNKAEGTEGHAQLKAAYDENITRFAEEYEKTFQEVKEMIEVGTDYGVLAGEIKHAQNAIKKHGPEGLDDWDALRMMTEAKDLDELRGVMRTYDDLRQEFRSAGISQREETALLMEIYKVPTIKHLPVEHAEELLRNGKVELRKALGAQGEEIRFMEGPDAFREAIKEYAGSREVNKYFVQPFREGVTPLAKEMEDMWLPIEAALLMRETGIESGSKALRFLDTASRARGVGYTLERGAEFLHGINRLFKQNVTVYNPALHFQRRNQMDAALKMYTYGGFAAFNPKHLLQFKDWATGQMVGDIIQANGGRVPAKEARDYAHRHLLQSYEHRFDVERNLQSAATPDDLMEVGTEVRKQTEQAAKAGAPRVFRPGFRGASTQGRMPSLYDVVVGWGPQSVEVTDNTLRMWLYYNEIRAGKSIVEAAANAGKWARNYMNMSIQERKVISAFPALFYNFSKQNMIAVAKALTEQPGRSTFWPKFIEWSNSEIPDDLRPHWSNVMDTILGRDNLKHVMLDMTGIEPLDAAANYMIAGYNALTGKRPAGPVFNYANKQFLDQAPPIFQQVFGDKEFYLNIEGWAGRALLDIYGEGEISFLGVPVGHLATKGTSGRPFLKLNKGMSWLLGLTGTGVWANTLFRHGRRAWKDKWFQTFGEGMGFFRLYDPTVGDPWFEERGEKAATEATMQQFRDDTWMLTEGDSGYYFWANWNARARGVWNATLLKDMVNPFLMEAKKLRKAFQMHQDHITGYKGEEE